MTNDTNSPSDMTKWKRERIFPIHRFSPTIQELCRLPNSPTHLLEQPVMDYVAKFSLSDKDIPALIEIASWGDRPEKNLGEFYSAPIYAWNALIQLDPKQVVPELLEMINHLDWDRVGGFIDEIQESLTVLGSRAPETIPLILDALKDDRRHETTRILLLDAVHNAIAETNGDWSALHGILIDQLKEFRIDCRQWYGAIVPELCCPDEPNQELANLLRKICLEGYADLRLIASCEGLVKLAGIDFENDPKYEPIYDEFKVIGQIMEDFWTCERIFPEVAFLRARERRDRIIPTLIETVRNQTAYARFGVPGGRGTVQFAVHLLAEFEAKEALPAIFDSLSLSENQIYTYSYKDGLYESMPGILRRLLGDDLEIYDQKLRDQGTPIALRNCLLGSLAYLVSRNVISEQRFCELLHDYLELAVVKKYGSFATDIIDYLIHTADPKYIPLVLEAYKNNLIDEERISQEEAVGYLSGDSEYKPLGMEYVFPTAGRDFSDTLEELSSWAWFQPEPERVSKPKSDQPIVIDVSDGPPVLHLSSLTRPPVPVPMNGNSGREPMKATPKVGRNDPCPCGSGKKYKKCCMK